MAEGKLDCFNLGERGVVLNESPIHKQIGDVTKGQNVIRSKEEGLGGLRKRGGLTALNGTAAAGSITGIVPVPLDDTTSDTETLYLAAAREDTDWGTTKWRTTTNGTTFTNRTTPEAAQDIVTQQTGDFNQAVAYPIASLGGKIYYAGNDYTVGTDEPILHCWDGTTDYEVFQVPDHPSYPATKSRAIYHVLAANQKIYFSTLDRAMSGNPPNHAGRVFEFNPDSGEVKQVGNAFGPNTGEATGGFPYVMAWWQGRLWACTNPDDPASAGDTGTVKWIRPGIDTTWTSDVTLPTGQVGISMATYRSNLYVGCWSAATAGTGQAIIRQRTPAGTWSTTDNGAANVDGQYSSLVVSGTSLYAARTTIQSGGSHLIRVYDGTSWTTDQDVWTLTDPDVNEGGQLIEFGGSNVLLYLSRTIAATGTTDVLRRSGGSWSLVNTTQKLRMMAVLTT